MTNDPTRSNYEPYYEDPDAEYERLLRCAQQGFEDLLTTLKRAERIRPRSAAAWNLSATTGGLRCARLSLREAQREIGADGIRVIGGMVK